MSVVAMILSAMLAAQPAPAEDMRADAKGRPTVGVYVNDAGPFHMVVDTAAQTSLITAGLAETLALAPLDDEIGVSGVAGSASVRLYPVDRMTNRLFDERDVAVPALPNSAVTEARGILGMDLFQTAKLTFDRARGRLSVGASAPAADGFVAHAGRTTADGALVVPLVLDGVAVDAVVDTGAEGSVAGPAVLAALGWRADDPRLRPYGQMRGAAPGSAAVRVAEMASVAIGPVTFRQVPLVFAAGMDRSGESGRPTMILGLDMLNLLQAFAVDFARGELQIYVPPR